MSLGEAPFQGNEMLPKHLGICRLLTPVVGVPSISGQKGPAPNCRETEGRKQLLAFGCRNVSRMWAAGFPRQPPFAQGSQILQQEQIRAGHALLVLWLLGGLERFGRDRWRLVPCLPRSSLDYAAGLHSSPFSHAWCPGPVCTWHKLPPVLCDALGFTSSPMAS